MVTLRKKARIMIIDSCVLIGVCDQQGLLKDGDVFVQIRPDSFYTQTRVAEKELIRLKKDKRLDKVNSRPDEQVITGDVLVTKNPCSHPGDVRKLKAVDIPELRHLYNVVVFNT